MRKLIVFGDSYSSPRLRNGEQEPEVWVDYLVGHLAIPSKDVLNFAKPGAGAEDDLSAQMEQFFLQFPKKKGSSSATALYPADTTYVFFFGINDCGRTDSDDLEPIVEGIYDAIHDLYIKAGARNFLLVDVPPVDRSPSGIEFGSDELRGRIEAWNNLLQAKATEFASGARLATVLVASSHNVLTGVLDDPSEYGFSADASTDEGGDIWEDDLHITPAVHAVLSDHILETLANSTPAYK